MLNAAGERLGNARLVITDLHPRAPDRDTTWWSRCDAEGLAWLPPSNEPDGYTLCVPADGDPYVPTLYHHRVRPGDREVVVVVPLGGHIGADIEFPEAEPERHLWRERTWRLRPGVCFWLKRASEDERAITQGWVDSWSPERRWIQVGWLPPGDYDIAFGGRGATRTPPRRVTVAPPRTVDAGTVRLRRSGAEVRMRFTMPQPSEGDSCAVRIDRLDVAGWERWGFTWSWGWIDPDGTPTVFVARIPPGRYLARVSFGQLPSTEVGPFDVTDQGRTVIIQPSPVAGTARVSVQDETGRPRAGALVRIAQGLATWRGGHGETRGRERQRPALTDAAGTFEIPDLAPGRWHVQIAANCVGQVPSWREAGEVTVVADTTTTHVAVWPR